MSAESAYPGCGLVPPGSGAPRADDPGYSTVTVLARLRGWSTFIPRRRAMR